MTPTLNLLCRLVVSVGAPVPITDGVPGRRYVPIVGGVVKDGLDGTILPGGGDWQTIRPDGTLDIDAHYVLDITNHGTVEVHSQGVRSGPPEVLAALGRGEYVEPSAYYFRTFIRLQTAAPELKRLNNILTVSVGVRKEAAVELEIFELG